MTSKPQIEYLNTDLDLVAPCSLDGLCAELTALDLLGNVSHGEDGLWYATFADRNDNEPEPNIVRLLNALDRLSPAAVQELRQCDKIEFNIGYDCGDEPWSFNQGLSHDTLRRIVGQGASLRITLYPYIPPGDPRIKHADLTNYDH